MTDPGLRASDADRQRVVTALERHAVAGRIDLDEYAVRVDRIVRCPRSIRSGSIYGDADLGPVIRFGISTRRNRQKEQTRYRKLKQYECKRVLHKSVKL